MKLKNIDIIKSPIDKEKVRLMGEVDYGSKSELYWFEVDKEYEKDLSKSGNPWLVCLLPLAATIGQPIELCLPIDNRLSENVKKLVQIWRSWYPHLHSVNIEADVKQINYENAPQKTAAFFSGGIDSFFTVLRHNKPEDELYINELLFVWGFDIPLDNAAAFKNMHTALQVAASDLGKRLITVATNLRETQWQKTKWGELSHGCALAGVGLALEKRFKNLLIASSPGMHPWGSHPLTDPLSSTSKMAVIHDSPEVARLAKTEAITVSELARRSLHVCWKLKSHENCSRCSKCYRTMMMLDLYVSLNKFITFNRKYYDIEKISKFYIKDYADRMYLNQMREAAITRNRTDLVRAIDRSYKHSARINKSLSIIEIMVKGIPHKKIASRLMELLEGVFLKGSII